MEKSAASGRNDSYRLRTYLFWLIGIALLPALILAGVVAWQLWHLQDRQLDRSLEQGAQALSLALEREIFGYARALTVLAQSPLLEAGEWSRFHALAVQVAQKTGMLSIALFRSDGVELLHTSHKYGEELPQPLLKPPGVEPETAIPTADASAVSSALMGRTGVTDLFVSASLKRPIFTVAVPVSMEGQAHYTVAGALNPEAIASFLQSEFPGTTAAVVDRNRRIVARSVDGVARTGAFSQLLGGIPPMQSAAVGRGMNREGQQLAFAFKRSPMTGWMAVVGLPTEKVWADAVGALALGGALFLLLLVLSILSAGALARHIRRSVDGLVAVASGAPATRSSIREFFQVQKALTQLATSRKNEERERERRLVAELQQEETARENRRKDLYLATLSHELRNPMAPIRNAVAIMRLKGDPDKELVWALDVIERQSAQMTRLLDDLLDASRLGQGKIHLHQSRLDVADAVHDALEMSSPAVKAGRHELKIDLPAQPVYVDGDRMRLAQVFSNLIANAARYTDPGGHIRVSLTEAGGDAVVSVSDDGMGIEPKLLDSIFKPFSQSREAVQRAQGGLGIGLALVKGLVELHQGTVSANSAGHGKGSQFTVSLPLSRSGEAKDLSPNDASATDGRLALRVLVVDDNKDAADSLAKVLQATGANVQVCYDGTSAIASAKKTQPDAAILDIGMPGMNGYDLARALASSTQRPYLIAVTGWGQESDKERAKSARFDHHLTKPIDLHRLLEMLRTVQPGHVASARIAARTGVRIAEH
jgi:signal transduction histidine kinase/CheY-like chemotaxis protein